MITASRAHAVYGVKGAFSSRASLVALFPVIAAERICDERHAFSVDELSSPIRPSGLPLG